MGAGLTSGSIARSGASGGGSTVGTETGVDITGSKCNFCPGIVCVLCVQYCVVFGGGPDIVLTTHSGRFSLVYLSSPLVSGLLFPIQASDPRV